MISPGCPPNAPGNNVDDALTSEISKLIGPIAVIGGGGFIGSNLFRRILAVRDDVYAVTDQPYVPWRLLGLENAGILRGDVTRPWELRELFARHKFETIFYLAAYGGYARQSFAGQTYQTNLIGLLNTLEEALPHGFSVLVHAGSSSEYGSNCAGPTEDSQLVPNSHYAVSKVAASNLLRHLASTQALPVVNLRLYSVYGPWEEPDRLIPRLIQAGLAGHFPPFVAPEISRDFVYIDDVVEAFILAATRGVVRAPGASINIATGRPTNIREVAAHAKRLFDLRGEPVWSSMPNRSWDLEQWYGNPGRAREILGWEARTSFPEGLQATVDWTRRQSAVPEVRSHKRLDSSLRISAVVASYKDEPAVTVMHERLAKVFRDLKVDYEIIFVNDASPDDTRSVLQSLCERDEHVIAVEHSRNFGSQNAFLSGMGISTGDAVVLLDGDLQDPPELIPEFFKHWREGSDVVYGRRVKREASAFKNVCFKLFYRLLNRIAYVPIPLDAGDFSLIDRRVVNELLAFPETDQFLRGLRAWVGFRQTSVDYVRPERLFGKSTNSWLRNIWWARKGIFSFSFFPLDLLFYGGSGLTVLSLFGLVSQVIWRLLHPSIPQGVTTLIVLILFFGGLQLMGLSVLGEYLGKTLEETKHRPRFIRRSIQQGRAVFENAAEIREFIRARVSAP